jgi:hypothetical protein
MTQYLCCIHCGPGCPNNDEHDLACPKGCLPYAHQQEDENMSETENIAATALEETLEFEREQWVIERDALTDENARLASLVRTLDGFVLDTTKRLAAALYIAEEDSNALECFQMFFQAYLDTMPTPSKMDMQEHLEEHIDGEREVRAALNALGSHLVELGYDPDEIIAAKQKADQDFLSTLLSGFRESMGNYLETLEDPDA